MPRRPAIIAFSFLMTFLSSGVSAQDAIRLVMLGDDVLFGHGEAAQDRLPARLAGELAAEGRLVEIIQSPSVDSSKGAAIWLGSRSARSVLEHPANSAVILGVGHWDCTMMPLEQTKANLDRIIAAFLGKDVPLLLVATRPRTFCGAAYNAEYPALFPALAKEHDTLLYVDETDPPPDERPEGVNYITKPVPLGGILPFVRQLLDQVH